jgi:hypothetical protein
MFLKELINKSVYGTIGYIASQKDLDVLEQYIQYNLPVLRHFKQIIVATNYGASLQEENRRIWKRYFPDCMLLDSKHNRGHNHGYADLDNLIFDWCKQNDQVWLCKGVNDVIFDELILQKEVEVVDFYYMNGVGFGGMVPFNFNFEQIIEKAFYPQTNFYFINVSKTDYLNDKQFLDETYEYIQTIPNYNGKIWEYIEGWSCENLLKRCVERNNLSKSHLIPLEKYYTLLSFIKTNNIHDCSHKNIMIDGVCHFPYPENEVVQI